MDENADIFKDVSIYPAIPPEHDITHDIYLIKGALPPKMRIYRMPADLAEVQKNSHYT